MSNVRQIIDAMRTLGVTSASVLSRIQEARTLKDIVNQLAFIDTLLKADDADRADEAQKDGGK